MFKLILTVALAAFAMPAFAKQPSASKEDTQDPNRKICEKVETIGSRISSTRVCMTAEQWAEQRRDHRADVERAQKNVGIATGN